MGATWLTPPSIINIERKRGDDTTRNPRAVTAEELLTLALALDVPPAALLFPLGDENLVKIAPTVDLHPFHAARWMMGEIALSSVSASDSPWLAATLPLRMYRRLDETENAFIRAADDLKTAEVTVSDEPGHLDKAREARLRALHQFGQMIDYLVIQGIKVPRYAPVLLDEMESIGALQHRDLLRAQEKEGGSDGNQKDRAEER